MFSVQRCFSLFQFVVTVICISIPKKMSLEICYCDKEDIVMKYMHKIIERKFVSLNGLPPTCSGGI